VRTSVRRHSLLFFYSSAAQFAHLSDTKFFVATESTSSSSRHPGSSKVDRSRPSSSRRTRSEAMPSSVRLKHVAALSLIFSSLFTPRVSAQGNNATCISLQGSTLCPSFSSASIFTSLTADFPFLQYVSNVQDFDTQFATYITTDYAKYHHPNTGRRG
jgi:hypothetical protein